MKSFKKIYLEISNSCNLQCSFCPEVEREKFLMAPQEFEENLLKVLPYCEDLCLHLMGEPLSHPDFEKIVAICEKHQASINLTTNGTLLHKFHSKLFFKPCFKQINFSLHSFSDNFPNKNIKPYLLDILQFSKMAQQEAPLLYINYRLWNIFDQNNWNEENQEIVDTVCDFFKSPIKEKVHVGRHKSKRIIDRIYFHFDSRFEWPSKELPYQGEDGFCHALSHHLGVHANGTVVPCCLDKEAQIDLGNIYESSLEEIMQTSRFQNMQQGFKNKKLVEKLCQHCTYIKRF